MMSSQEPEETAIRVATLLAGAMNVVPALANASVLQAADRGEIRSTLLWIAEEMDWIRTIAGSMEGLAWLSDAQDRIERLRTVANAWDPAEPPASDLLDAARACLGMLQPGTARP